MKALILFLVLPLTVTAIETNWLGDYNQVKTIPTFYYASEDECVQDKGEWEDETCFFEIFDQVKISSQESSKYLLDITTIGNNLHTCHFSEEAELIATNELLAKVATEVMVMNEAGEWVWEKATCEVSVNSNADGSISVSSNDKCQEFCGANAYLNIENAKRVE